MSDDYLWDGSGEPDPEIQRLERVLGVLRAKPAPLAKEEEQSRALRRLEGALGSEGALGREGVVVGREGVPGREEAQGSEGMLGREGALDRRRELAEAGPARAKHFGAPSGASPVLRFRPRSPSQVLAAALGVAAVVVLLVVGVWYTARSPRPSWQVASLEGAPRIGQSRIAGTGRLAVGDSLETDASSRAKINVGTIGQVVVEPNSKLRLLEARWMEHRLALDRGTMHASIWAPPRLFFVDTPSAVAVDLGCAYTLQVDETGSGLLTVTTGWVSFERDGRESIVPAGARCVTRPAGGPGTPHFEDASAAMRASLSQLDFQTLGAAERESAVDTILEEARPRDALTLWHLLARLDGEDRARVYDRLAQLVPPPAGVSRQGVLQGNSEMLDRWWDELGLGQTLWRKAWKRVME